MYPGVLPTSSLEVRTRWPESGARSETKSALVLVGGVILNYGSFRVPLFRAPEFVFFLFYLRPRFVFWGGKRLVFKERYWVLLPYGNIL